MSHLARMRVEAESMMSIKNRKTFGETKSNLLIFIHYVGSWEKDDVETIITTDDQPLNFKQMTEELAMFNENVHVVTWMESHLTV